jgi:hypothetical protein
MPAHALFLERFRQFHQADMSDAFPGGIRLDHRRASAAWC